jgi:hypothetical protein
MKLFHYTKSYYPGSLGGVARFDHELHKIFPDIITTENPKHIEEAKNAIAITGNNMCLEISDRIPVVSVHHGCAATHKEREPSWAGNHYVAGQQRMAKRPNTFFVAPSTFMKDEFKRHHNIDSELILHSVETTPIVNTVRAKKVIGDWRDNNKGIHIVKELQKVSSFEFIPLRCGAYDKAEAYSTASIYLTLSLSEGCSYSQLDAIACNLPVLSTTVSLFYKDMPTTCGIAINWRDRDDFKVIEEELNFIYDNYDKFEPRKWLVNNNSFDNWKAKWNNLINRITKQYGLGV